MKQLEAEQPFVLTCIAHDTLAGRFLTPIQDPDGLAQRMYDFCSDIVDQGWRHSSNPGQTTAIGQRPFLLVGLKALVTEMIDIPGLLYSQNFISESYEAELIETIDRQPWLTDLKRRVQHYGYKYDYKARSVDSSMYLGPLPDWALEIAGELYSQGLMPRMPDQLIVNEYEPGQGISAHVDCKPCFDNTIVSISLGSSCVMNFTSVKDKTKYPLFLERRSVVVLAGEARYDWQHSIPARKSDVYEGERIARQRRLSLTLRNVLVDRHASR